MLSNRAELIKAELLKSYIISGKPNLTPSNELIEMQAVLTDNDLDLFITEDKISILFDCARHNYELPNITSLRKSIKDGPFKDKFRVEMISLALRGWGAK